jgi:hypothetical protein
MRSEFRHFNAHVFVTLFVVHFVCPSPDRIKETVWKSPTRVSTSIVAKGSGNSSFHFILQHTFILSVCHLCSYAVILPPSFVLPVRGKHIQKDSKIFLGQWLYFSFSLHKQLI